MIKVEDAISNLKYQMLRFAKGTEPYIALKMAVKALDEQPAIEERKGKWIADEYIADYTNALTFHCSLCGGHIIDYECQVYAENPHCKWCGARMEGAEE